MQSFSVWLSGSTYVCRCRDEGHQILLLYSFKLRNSYSPSLFTSSLSTRRRRENEQWISQWSQKRWSRQTRITAHANHWQKLRRFNTSLDINNQLDEQKENNAAFSFHLFSLSYIRRLKLSFSTFLHSLHFQLVDRHNVSQCRLSGW